MFHEVNIRFAIHYGSYANLLKMLNPFFLENSAEEIDTSGGGISLKRRKVMKISSIFKDIKIFLCLLLMDVQQRGGSLTKTLLFWIYAPRKVEEKKQFLRQAMQNDEKAMKEL